MRVFFFLILFGSSWGFTQEPIIGERNVVEPSFPGGMDSLMLFIHKNLAYPERVCLSGKIYVGFTVEATGIISNPIIKRGVCPELDSAVLDVIALMPKWIPGEIDGKNAPINFTIPITICYR